MLENPQATKDALIQWIRDYFGKNGPNCSAVVGISGGKDSTIVAALCKEALGADRVVGVLMPNGVQSDIDDAQAVVNHLGIPHMTVNIGAAYEALTHAIVQAKGYDVVTGRTDLSKDAAINTPPRLRMATLYAVGQNLPNGARVANTSPLAQLVVEEVRQIGKLLDIPLHLVDKVPSDGLSGQSDEDKLGFTYAILDRYIRTGEIEDQPTKERIDYLNRINKHKLELMPSFDPKL
ncbi:MAG: NAD(+) synthase [Veillonella sp.]|nr:NAD(+) synthase [Veillonella sp.]